MFGIGPTELIVILVIALLVLGPKRLPELARSLGKALGEFRRATSDITAEFDSARTVLEEEARGAAESVEKAANRPAVGAPHEDKRAAGTEVRSGPAGGAPARSNDRDT